MQMSNEYGVPLLGDENVMKLEIGNGLTMTIEMT